MVRTLWGEARNESEETWRAIAEVIITRAHWPTKSYWGTTIEEVCTSPWQFSCWNPSDPNRHKILNLTTKDKKYQAIQKVCIDLLNNSENSEGVTTFYCRATAKPVWRGNLDSIKSVGKYLFFNIAPAA
jgi:N-acetylmuramoyl-L-alanine amidase